MGWRNPMREGFATKNLLLIEDDEGQKHVTERLYQMAGRAFHGEVEFLTVSTWAEGMRIIGSICIDVLITDLILPLDDPQLRRDDTINLIESTPDLPPVVVLTGIEDDPFLRDRCILSGADGFMQKTEANRRPELLCEKVYDAFLRRQRLLRSHEKRP